jgi:predicted metal-dependent phosphoesterase TrpH
VQLARRAAARQVDVIALTDHDSVQGVAACTAAAGAIGVVCVPGVELSSDADGRDAHILGYFVDPADETLLGRLAMLRGGRLERAERMVRALDAAGYAIRLEDVLEHSGEGAVGRSHVARALVSRGHADDIRDAFVRFIGASGPYYERKRLPGPAEVIATIRAAGGVAVLAHPAVSRITDLVAPLAAAGLGGVEAYHSEHSPRQSAELAAMAAEHGLVVTGGTDYHGPEGPSPDIGDIDIPDGVYSALLAAAGR